MPIWVTLQGIFSTTIVLGIIAVLVRDVLLQRQHSRFLDELQWNRTVQERAATVAAYLALATRLRADSPPEDFERAERMSFELAMWLPAEIYRETRDAIMKPGDPEVNFGTAVIAVRKLLLKGKSADDLQWTDIARHYPLAGQRSALTPSEGQPSSGVQNSARERQ